MVLGLFQEFARNRQDADNVLVLTKAFEKISNVASSGLSASERGFPGFEAVHTTLVGKNEQSVFAEASGDELRGIFGLGGDPLESTTATVLCSERLHRCVPDVIVLAQGNDDGTLFNEVFTVH